MWPTALAAFPAFPPLRQASKCSNFPGIRLCWLSVKQINKINFVLKLPKRNNVTRRQMTTTAAFTLR